ncbi:sulfotransferase domain-containing protein [Pelagibacterium limicola]|uniref:sulfotransferase domain-containing protein n=1 Tax=Pelagibacterium limicola TaxID=2791022 RepID=UPI0018AF8A5D
MPAPEKPIRPLYFVASYPRSGGSWVRSVIYLLITLSQPNPPKQVDLRNLDNIIPWDAHGLLYKAVTGREHDQLDELEVAAARPKVHKLLATEDFAIPVIRTHAIRGTFHGHQTINPAVTGGATYVVRNPLDVAATLVAETGAAPLKIIELMMTSDRRVRPAGFAVTEPQGSWTQNVASWTAAGQKEILVLRFEDMVDNPTREFRKLAKHMALPASDAVIDKAAGLMVAARKEEGRENKRPDYRETLQPAHARAIIEGHAIEMDRHGYLTERVLQYAGIDREAALKVAAKYAPGKVS